MEFQTNSIQRPVHDSPGFGSAPRIPSTVKVALIGGGHVGSLLGLALQREGARVTIFTQSDAASLRAGRILSSQCIWAAGTEIEERWAPAPWKERYAGIGGFRIRLASLGAQPECDLVASLERPGNSVDQRFKVSLWLDTFEAQGGGLVVGEISGLDLEQISEAHDLVIVSAGKFRGDLADLFSRDEARSRYTQTQRVGAVVYLDGRAQDLSDGRCAAREEWSVVPGVGDFLPSRPSRIGALATSSACRASLAAHSTDFRMSESRSGSWR